MYERRVELLNSFVLYVILYKKNSHGHTMFLLKPLLVEPNVFYSNAREEKEEVRRSGRRNMIIIIIVTPIMTN